MMNQQSEPTERTPTIGLGANSYIDLSDGAIKRIKSHPDYKEYGAEHLLNVACMIDHRFLDELLGEDNYIEHACDATVEGLNEEGQAILDDRLAIAR